MLQGNKLGKSCMTDDADHAAESCHCCSPPRSLILTLRSAPELARLCACLSNIVTPVQLQQVPLCDVPCHQHALARVFVNNFIPTHRCAREYMGCLTWACLTNTYVVYSRATGICLFFTQCCMTCLQICGKTLLESGLHTAMFTWVCRPS